MIHVSRHAAERYVERVRPTLDPAQAQVELQRLADTHGRMVADPPDWYHPEAAAANPPDGWLMVGDDIALPVLGRMAMTCIPRGFIGDGYRVHLTRAKRIARGVRKARGGPKRAQGRREDKDQPSRRRASGAGGWA